MISNFFYIYKSIFQYSVRIGVFYGVINGLLISNYQVNSLAFYDKNFINYSLIYLKNTLYYSFYNGITIGGILLLSPPIISISIIFNIYFLNKL